MRRVDLQYGIKPSSVMHITYNAWLEFGRSFNTRGAGAIVIEIHELHSQLEYTPYRKMANLNEPV